MPKPFAKMEIGYLDHPKFQALSANAICLWHEGKQYCDRFHTDGLIPKDALKRFRFSGKRSIEQLLTPIPLPKPNGTAYSPLWEMHPVGMKMHDYLDHNDCRDEVLARIEDADDAKTLRKLANAKRQAEYRAKRKAEIAAQHVTPVTCDIPRDSTRDVTRTCSTPTTTATTTATNKERETAAAPPVTHRTTPIIGRRRLEAAWEGPRGLYVTDKQHRHFVELRGGDEKSVRQFYDAVAAAYDDGGPRRSHETGSDMFKFWSARYDEKWPATPVAAAPKDTGVVYQKMPSSRPVTEAR